MHSKTKLALLPEQELQEEVEEAWCVLVLLELCVRASQLEEASPQQAVEEASRRQAVEEASQRQAEAVAWNVG